MLVENIKHTILSVSQMCDQGHTLTFDLDKCKIKYRGTGSLVATATRNQNNVYILDEKEEICFLGQVDWS